MMTDDKRKAPIRPLINRAKMLAQDAAALQRRVKKRFPASAVAILARGLARDSAYLALLLNTYKHDQPPFSGEGKL